jgi:hypothetical protein
MNPYGPPGIVDQLQFTFDEIPPLSLEERVSNWLSQQDEETHDVLTAMLFLGDNDSRRRRASRWSEIRNIQKPYDSKWGWLVSGGSEVAWLYDEACRGYIAGSYFSALLCAHAACERVLAGVLSSYSEDLDKGWLMWGLGKLIKAARDRKLFDDETLDDLSRLSEIRKVSAHYKSFLDTPNSVQRRAIEILENNPDLDDDEVLDDITRSDALFALELATAMVRGNVGFGGDRFRPSSR